MGSGSLGCDNNIRPILCQSQSNRLADSSRGTSDNHGLTAETSVGRHGGNLVNVGLTQQEKKDTESEWVLRSVVCNHNECIDWNRENKERGGETKKERERHGLTH
ncbi:hypothetical protein PMAYCL1PPCAC_06545 [Pristionchus mayeri]|uniref:Uncharacterized protein n=1 Tax=Pristionchus mayeri TaxID=1317129 RepID=A0AAN5CA52_9BILA|nr:hypothetical protein PMAYCL1PPCAC_06545 [Pristionchus mayeri]